MICWRLVLEFHVAWLLFHPTPATRLQVPAGTVNLNRLSAFAEAAAEKIGRNHYDGRAECDPGIERGEQKSLRSAAGFACRDRNGGTAHGWQSGSPMISNCAGDETAW